MVEHNEFRWGGRDPRNVSFAGFLKRTGVGANARGELLRRLRKGKTSIGSPLQFDDTGARIEVQTLEEAIGNLDGRVLPGDVDLLRSLWAEFLRLNEKPVERETRLMQTAVRRAESVKRRQKEVAAKNRKANEKIADEWARLGGERLDQPAFFDGGWFVRNQVCGREFLHEVLGLADLNIREERLVVSEALRRLPGWERLRSPKLHRGETQFVFRRKGTDGKPTAVEAPAKRRRVI